MQDALLIYLMLAHLRHSACLAVVAGSLRWAKAKCLLIWAAVGRQLNNAASAALAVVQGSSRFCSLGARVARAVLASQGSAGANVMTQMQWMQALARLENYVASAA